MSPDEESKVPSDRVPRGGSPLSDEELDLVVAACLEGSDGDLETSVSRACERHPESAGEIRRRIERLRRMGLVSPRGLVDRSQTEDFPEQLGDFRLLERLGEGGMGVVFRARQETLGREVALKLIRPELLYFPRARARFQRETRAAARLQHPGIVPIHTVGEEGGLPFFVMELVHGATLGDALRELAGREPASLTARDLSTALERSRPAWVAPSAGGPDADGGGYVEAVLRLALQVAQALHHAHGRDVLHRDVKPTNVAIAPDGRALLLDFGLAALVEPVASDGSGPVRFTASNAEIGSLPYMAPEQLRGRSHDIGPRTDVYGLGVTLYELLTLRMPFAGTDPVDLRRAILEGAPRPVRVWNRAVGRDLETVVSKAMERSPARRYADAADLARDLANVLEHRPVGARPRGPLRELAGAVRRHPLAATVAAAALAIPTALFLQQKQHARELERALDEAGREREIARIEARTASGISDFLLELFDSVDPSQAQGREVSARDLLDAAARKLESGSELASEPIVQMRLLAAIGESYTGLEQWGPARATLERALAASAGLPDSPELARALSALAMIDQMEGRPEALEHARRAAEVRRGLAEGPSFELADALLTYGIVLQGQNRLDEAESVYRETLEVVEALPGDQRSGRVGALANLARLHLVRGDNEQALAEARETVELQRSISPEPHPAIGSALNVEARALTALGRTEAALAIMDEILDEEARLTGTGSARYAGFLSSKADALVAVGRTGEAIEEFQRAVELFAQTVPPTNRNAIITRERLSAALVASARWNEALAQCDELVPALAGGSDPWRERMVEYRRALCREALGDAEGSKREARAALARARAAPTSVDDPSECLLSALLARALAREGDPAGGEAALAEAAGACGEPGELAPTGVQAWVRLARGELAGADGDCARARQELEPLAAFEVEGTARTVPALARAALAALAEQSDPARARTLAERAAAELEELWGADHPQARSARALLERLP